MRWLGVQVLSPAPHGPAVVGGVASRIARKGVGGFPSGQREQTVNLSANAFGGSNPPPPTTVRPLGAGIAQLAEHQPSKLRVAGSSPVSRSSSLASTIETKIGFGAHVAQSVEHLHGKQAVSSSNLLVGSTQSCPNHANREKRRCPCRTAHVGREPSTGGCR